MQVHRAKTLKHTCKQQRQPNNNKGKSTTHTCMQVRRYVPVHITQSINVLIKDLYDDTPSDGSNHHQYQQQQQKLLWYVSVGKKTHTHPLTHRDTHNTHIK